MAYVTSIVSAKSLFLTALVAVCLYYGWPIVEAIILILPIPDPKGAVDGMRSLGNQATDMV